MDNLPLSVIHERLNGLEAKLEQIINNDLKHIRDHILKIDVKLWLVIAGLLVIIALLLLH